MGRHTQPGTGAPAPDRGFWVRLAVLVLVVVLAGGWYLTRGDDGDRVTGQPQTSRDASSTNPSSSATTSPSPSTSPSSTPSASPTKRPATLSFVVRRKSYITVRIPGGRTLVSRLFPAGARRSFDQKVLQVVNGRPTAVRFTVNGKPRKPGPADQPETFTVRRR